MITVNFNYVIGNDILNVVASADSAENYEAENLKVRFFNEDGDRIFPEIHRDVYEDIFVHAIAELTDKNGYKELEF